MAQILNKLQTAIASRYQYFDPTNVDHLKAYYMLKHEGRQHPDLRFFLEESYHDVVLMMQDKISEQFLKEHLNGNTV